MEKFGVQIALEALREAREAWRDANLKFQAQHDYAMTRLIFEAARNFMSAEQVAKVSGLTTKRVRGLMRGSGLDPKRSKTLLAKQAAEALQENAALLGIEPHEMDLMSPLAYLPMGQELRRILETEASRGVKDLDDEWDETGARMLNDLSDAIYQAMPGEGKTFHEEADRVAAADHIAEALLAAGWHR